MSKPKLGKNRNEIFSLGQPRENIINSPLKPVLKDEHKEPDKLESRGRGRPQQHQDEWSKVTVVLLEKQIHWLDRLSLDIRGNTKAAVSRAEIIRSLISAMEESGIDLTQSTSEQELKSLVLTLLKP